MRQMEVRIWMLGMIVLAWVLSPAMVMATQAADVKCSGEIEWDVVPTAKIISLSCELGKHKKDPALLYKVAIKNVSDKPARFRINIFLLDMDKAAGHLVPRKGKPPVVAPGKTETVTIPFIKTQQLSKKMLVVVKTLD